MMTRSVLVWYVHDLPSRNVPGKAMVPDWHLVDHGVRWTVLFWWYSEEWFHATPVGAQCEIVFHSDRINSFSHSSAMIDWSRGEILSISTFNSPAEVAMRLIPNRFRWVYLPAASTLIFLAPWTMIHFHIRLWLLLLRVPFRFREYIALQSKNT